MTITALTSSPVATEILSYNAGIPAGFPSPAADYMEERIDLNKELVPRPHSTFVVSCQGDSMINAFIPPRARLVVDRSLTAKSGDIVLAIINGEFTVKFFKQNDHNCFLVPANSKYKDIKVLPEMNMEVWGVVTTIITEVKDVKRCML